MKTSKKTISQVLTETTSKLSDEIVGLSNQRDQSLSMSGRLLRI